MTAELVTIGIACYNAADTIERAVTSALAQDWPNLEVLVVDDGSSDASVSIVESLCRKDARVRLVRHAENTGAGGARATLTEAARGEYIAFFDDDDESLPERVRAQVQTLREYEARTSAPWVACYASGVRAYPNGYRLTLPAIGSQPQVPRGEEVADYLLFNERKPGVFYGAGTPTCALLARMRTIERAGGFDRTFRRVEDADFAVRLALIGAHFIGCPELLFTQYATTGSDKTAEANYAAERQLLDKHRNYLRHRRRYRYAHNWFRVRYHHFGRRPWRALGALLWAWLNHPWLVSRHFLRSAPRRLLHELRMRAKRVAG